MVRVKTKSMPLGDFLNRDSKPAPLCISAWGSTAPPPDAPDSPPAATFARAVVPASFLVSPSAPAPVVVPALVTRQPKQCAGEQRGLVDALLLTAQ